MVKLVAILVKFYSNALHSSVFGKVRELIGEIKYAFDLFLTHLWAIYVTTTINLLECGIVMMCLFFLQPSQDEDVIDLDLCTCAN